MALYNDRVYAYERMEKLDKVIDKEPTLDNIRQMVTDDERNRLAFFELEHYQKTGAFLYKHPILVKYKLTNDLEQLRKASPERFMSELVNADKNITRYRSLIKNNKYKDEEERMAWEGHIGDLSDKLGIMKLLISQ
jgi:hypothetical protein